MIIKGPQASSAQREASLRAFCYIQKSYNYKLPTQFVIVQGQFVKVSDPVCKSTKR